MSEPDDLSPLLNQHLGGFNELIGLRFTRVVPGEVVAELDLGPRHHQPYGLVHGGLYATVVETVCSTGAALALMERGLHVVGRENTTTFKRATRGGRLTARARPLSEGVDAAGRATPVWTAELHDEQGRLVARGQVTLTALPQGASLAGEEITLKTGEG